MPDRLLLAIMVLAQLADATSFVVGVSIHGIHLESNGMAVAAYGLGGVDAVVLLKGTGILVVLGTLVASAGRFPRVLMWGGGTATSFGLLGFLTNVTALALLA